MRIGDSGMPVVVMLSSNGESIEDFCADMVRKRSDRGVANGIVAVLGDDRGISAETEEAIEKAVRKRNAVLRHVSLGEEVSTCCIYIGGVRLYFPTYMAYKKCCRYCLPAMPSC